MFDNSSMSEKDIVLALSLKSLRLQRESNVNVEKTHLLDTLLATKWKNNLPNTINEVLTDIFSLNIEEIVAYLSTNIVMSESSSQFDDLQDLIGGLYEKN